MSLLTCDANACKSAITFFYKTNFLMHSLG
jgi:hypothetical protein